MAVISLLLAVSVFLSFSVCSLRQYHFVNTLMTWTEAQRYCRENHTDLTTVTSMNDMQDIINTVNNEISEYIWIGLHDINRNKEWRWSLEQPAFYSGNESQYRNWGQNQPEHNNEYCVCMKKNERWHSLHCSEPSSFICYNNSINTFIIEDELKTWHEAQRYCRQYHTDLASVRNHTEDQNIQNLIKDQTKDKRVWIGLFRDSWVWSDNSSSTYRNWSNGEPNYPDIEDCTKITVKDRSWINTQCEEKLPFVCHDDDFILIRENLTWSGALEYCRRIQMDLVCVESEAIQRRVVNVMRNASTSEVWLGLRHSCVVGIWFWVSGELMCYQKWSEGNGTGKEDCSDGRVAAIQTGSDHTWISLPETHKLNFICSKVIHSC